MQGQEGPLSTTGCGPYIKQNKALKQIPLTCLFSLFPNSILILVPNRGWSYKCQCEALHFSRMFNWAKASQCREKATPLNWNSRCPLQTRADNNWQQLRLQGPDRLLGPPWCLPNTAKEDEGNKRTYMFSFVGRQCSGFPLVLSNPVSKSMWRPEVEIGIKSTWDTCKASA